MTADDIAATIRRLCRRRPPRRRGRVRRGRDPRRAWLSDQPVPLARRQQAHRPLWRQPREPHALRCSRSPTPCAPAGRRTSRCFVRISATDGIEGGWTSRISTVLARRTEGARRRRHRRVLGRLRRRQDSRPAPLYQVPLAKAVREAGIATIAVGLINEPARRRARCSRPARPTSSRCARGALEDPNWPIHARHVLDGAVYDLWPIQARERIRAKDRSLGLRQPQD